MSVHIALDQDFRFACPGWPPYTPESRRVHKIVFVVETEGIGLRWNTKRRTTDARSRTDPVAILAGFDRLPHRWSRSGFAKRSP